ncbi:MAG: 1-phosphofructokinase [Acholeplasmataceae bacterium]|nr:1-phosphofructokinase [Acholeplasmataceae bacterium]
MIYTCTLNPAVDYIIELGNLESNKLNRSNKAIFRAGGKGINVSVVLNNLGLESIATGFLGDFTGDLIKKDLQNYPLVQMDFIDINDTTRMNVKLNHGYKETEVNVSGPDISVDDFSKLLEQIRQMKKNDLLICSGSACKGISDAYLKIAQVCHQKKIPFIMDIPGKELMEVIKLNPVLIKPNLEELEDYFDIKIQSMSDVVLYGRKLIELGAKNVLISMGSKGSLFIDLDHVYRANSIHGHVVSTTGAGDSMVAGFMKSYLSDQDPKKAYLNAAIAASATVFSEGLATQETIKLYQNKIKIKEIHT